MIPSHPSLPRIICRTARAASLPPRQRLTVTLPSPQADQSSSRWHTWPRYAGRPALAGPAAGTINACCRAPAAGQSRVPLDSSPPHLPAPATPASPLCPTPRSLHQSVIHPALGSRCTHALSLALVAHTQSSQPLFRLRLSPTTCLHFPSSQPEVCD